MTDSPPSPTDASAEASRPSVAGRAEARDASAADAPTWKVVVAFAALYLIWGSTYLAIRFAIETLPPFTMAGVRFVVAGGALHLWARRVRKATAATSAEWRTAAVVGALLLLGGNGAVVWAEQWVPSGLVALLIATVPLWMVLLDRVAGGPSPSLPVVGGIVWGLVGVALLVGGDEIGGGGAQTLLGGLAVLAGSFVWAAGSIYSRHAPLPRSPMLGTALQMEIGGVLLLLAGAVLGEPWRVDPGSISLRSLLALAYLIVFGAIVAFSAYIWLLKVATPARVSTYAYVNPVVALVLGWALADEPLTPRTLVAAAIILTAVMVINAFGRRRSRRPRRGTAPSPSESEVPG